MATKYKSKFTGVQIDNSVETVVSNTATNGQVLTANGTGGATWQNASGGTEVVANPTLAGTESDLTGLEVAGTKYKVPTGGGTEVVANPTLAGTESDLTGLEVAGTKYKVPSGGGTEVVANPTGEATEGLSKLQVGSNIYSIPTGTPLYKHTISVVSNQTECVITVVSPYLREIHDLRELANQILLYGGSCTYNELLGIGRVIAFLGSSSLTFAVFEENMSVVIIDITSITQDIISGVTIL